MYPNKSYEVLDGYKTNHQATSPTDSNHNISSSQNQNINSFDPNQKRNYQTLASSHIQHRIHTISSWGRVCVSYPRSFSSTSLAPLAINLSIKTFYITLKIKKKTTKRIKNFYCSSSIIDKTVKIGIS